MIHLFNILKYGIGGGISSVIGYGFYQNINRTIDIKDKYERENGKIDIFKNKTDISLSNLNLLGFII